MQGRLWCTHAKFMGTRTVQWWFGTIFWAKLLGVFVQRNDRTWWQRCWKLGHPLWVMPFVVSHWDPLCSTFRAWKCLDTWSIVRCPAPGDNHQFWQTCYSVFFFSGPAICCVRTLHLHQPPWTRISLVLTVAHFYVSPGVGRSDHQRGRTLRTQV